MRLIASLLPLAVLITSCATTQPRQQAPQSQPQEVSAPMALLGATTALWWARRLRSRINSPK
jgi:hypothetical protein